MHEFRLIESGTRVLVTKYRIGQYDFGDLKRPRAIEDSIFQEIDIQSNAIIYEWHSVDHIQPGNISRFKPDITGVTPSNDYFHINSVDKNADGDYLVSSRHTSSIYKISGVDGSVLWRLVDGPESNFTVVNFSICGQHHVRWVSVRNLYHSQTYTDLLRFNRKIIHTHYSPSSIMAMME